jgi:hypothetical protein
VNKLSDYRSNFVDPLASLAAFLMLTFVYSGKKSHFYKKSRVSQNLFKTSILSQVHCVDCVNMRAMIGWFHSTAEPYSCYSMESVGYGASAPIMHIQTKQKININLHQ